ncbi:MAG TPA: hypothetical protein VFH03_02685 [Actinoplanes sp.]|nr:hypothetical protein [Actinoplanes sp.]
MVGTDQTELQPGDVVDRLLWQDAQRMLRRHTGPGPDGECVWCGWRWPCASRRVAERAEVASRRPWRVAWTLRHDLNSIRAMPALRTGLDGNGERQAPSRRTSQGRRATKRRTGLNRGYFD